MFRNTITRCAGACLALALVSTSCEKIEQGYLSDNMYYVANPLTAAQGGVTVSASLVADGSTAPLQVKLTRVVDGKGNDVDSIMTRTDSILGFSASVSYLDSTLDLLSKKIQNVAAKPLTINPIGGRIQLSPATQYVPLGIYTIDLRVSNIRGTRDIPQACNIIIAPGSPDTVYAGTYGGTFDPSTGNFIANIANPVVNVSYAPTATNKIIYKFVDRNGKLYDPKTSGMGTRTNRWNMKNFDPYYPEVLTDTSAEYQFPSVPNQFPVFSNPGVNGVIPRGNYGTFWAMPAASNSTGSAIFAFVDMAFFGKGTFIVTVQLSDITWN